jgi:hypothetical protein
MYVQRYMHNIFPPGTSFKLTSACVCSDLKPENLLIGTRWLPQTHRLQLRKKLPAGSRRTPSAEPGTLTGSFCRGHNRAADWWTVGVLIFELVAGHRPSTTRTGVPRHLSLYLQLFFLLSCAYKPVPVFVFFCVLLTQTREHITRSATESVHGGAHCQQRTELARQTSMVHSWIAKMKPGR